MVEKVKLPKELNTPIKWNGPSLRDRKLNRDGYLDVLGLKMPLSNNFEENFHSSEKEGFQQYQLEFWKKFFKLLEFCNVDINEINESENSDKKLIDCLLYQVLPLVVPGLSCGFDEKKRGAPASWNMETYTDLIVDIENLKKQKNLSDDFRTCKIYIKKKYNIKRDTAEVISKARTLQNVLIKARSPEYNEMAKVIIASEKCGLDFLEILGKDFGTEISSR